MTIKKPTAKQLFTHHLRVRKAEAKVREEKRKLGEMATAAGNLETIVEHDGFLYRIRTSRPYGYSSERVLEVSCLGDAKDFSAALGVAK